MEESNGHPESLPAAFELLLEDLADAGLDATRKEHLSGLSGRLAALQLDARSQVRPTGFMCPGCSLTFTFVEWNGKVLRKLLCHEVALSSDRP